MAISQTITVLPTPPSRADPANFDTRADAFLGALPTMQTQMNTWAGQANSTASDATGAAGDAEAAQVAAEAAQSGAVAAQGTATTQAGIATTQAGIATTQAGTATTQAGTATTQAGIATTQAGIATTQAGTATTQAGIATTQAGTATTKAGEASASAGTATTKAGEAAASAVTATTQAGTATTQAGIATTQAGTATTKAGEAAASAVTATTQAGTATTQAGIATTQAGIATTQAGIATTKAGEAAASAALAVDVVSGGLTSTTPAANKIPLADGAAKIALGWLDLTGYAPAAQGVTNGNSHDHNGGDGGQIAYANLSGLPTLGTAAATASSDYAPAAQGVTNGNSHDHNGGDGGQIAYANLSGLPTLGTAAATASSDYAPAAQGVTNGNSHDHNGGDGAQIAYASLSGLPTLGTAAAKDIPATGDATTSQVVYGTDTRLSNSRAPTPHDQSETTITFTDVATGNASTTKHGFEPKATAPASGLRSVLAIDNGETVRTDKALFDATNPAALGTASPGSAMTAARRDHVHALPVETRSLITVGSGGDFATLRAAINHLSQFTRRGGTTSYNDTVVEVRISTGHTIEHQVVIRAVDLSWVKITSVDAVVYANANAFDLNWLESTELDPSGGTVPLFKVVDGAVSPWISAQFAGPDSFAPTTHTQAGAWTYTVGIDGENGAKILINSGGFQDFGYSNIQLAWGSYLHMVDGSILHSGAVTRESLWAGIDAYNSELYIVGGGGVVQGDYRWTGSPENCIWLASCRAIISEATVGGRSGAYCYRGINVRRGSTVTLQDVDCNYYTDKGVLCHEAAHAQLRGGNYRVLPTGGSDAATDIAVDGASLVQVDATVVGGYSQTANTITSSGLIMS